MGIIAMAGALGGAGQGAVEVGQQGQKMDLLKKQNELATLRETAIAQMHIDSQKALQESGQRFEHGEKVEERTMMSNIATNKLKWQQQAFGTSMAQQKGLAESGWQAKKEIAHGHDIAKLGAAARAHPVKPVNAWGRPINVEHTIPGATPDAEPLKVTIPVMLHQDGSQWVNGGDGHVYPYNPSASDGIGSQKFDPKNLNRQQLMDKQRATTTLLQHPLDTAPSGLSYRDSYAQRYGGIPVGYQAAENAARSAKGEGGYEGGGAPEAPDMPDASESSSGPESSPVPVPED